jgi:hypothetical protein
MARLHSQPDVMTMSLAPAEATSGRGSGAIAGMATLHGLPDHDHAPG